jgi:pyruvate/2-oxoglutarate dehydrogenase complex dihydrolipoamide acyltransferase (E2) component
VAEGAPQKPLTEEIREKLHEREHEQARFALALIGREVLTFARKRNFATWPKFKRFLEEAFPLKEQAADSSQAVGPKAPEPPGAEGPKAGDGSTPAPAIAPAKVPHGQRPPITKAALEAMDAAGVDEELLLTFLGWRGSGPGGKVTPDDVERYLNG